MQFEGLKLYGVCLERLQHQISQALSRTNGARGRVVLESYMTSDPQEIIELLELFDIEHEDMESVMRKLKEIAEDVSMMVKRRVEFGFSDEGELCLYLVLERDIL